MEELGLIATTLFASQEPKSEIIMSMAPATDGGDAVIFDVIGLGDDAQYGVRLRVGGERANGAFTLEFVEATSLCGRGVSDGLCV